MTKKIIRITLAFILINSAFLIALILFPSFSYAHETQVEEVTIKGSANGKVH